VAQAIAQKAIGWTSTYVACTHGIPANAYASAAPNAIAVAAPSVMSRAAIAAAVAAEAIAPNTLRRQATAPTANAWLHSQPRST